MSPNKPETQQLSLFVSLKSSPSPLWSSAQSSLRGGHPGYNPRVGSIKTPISFLNWLWFNFFIYGGLDLACPRMAIHSSVLAWRIPRTGEPGGLPSMGSHRVRHDWSDLVAAAAAADGYQSSFHPSQRWAGRLRKSLPPGSHQLSVIAVTTPPRTRPVLIPERPGPDFFLIPLGKGNTLGGWMGSVEGLWKADGEREQWILSKFFLCLPEGLLPDPLTVTRRAKPCGKGTAVWGDIEEPLDPALVSATLLTHVQGKTTLTSSPEDPRHFLLFPWPDVISSPSSILLLH